MRRPSFRRVFFDGRPKNRKSVRLTFKSVEEKNGIVWMRDFLYFISLIYTALATRLSAARRTC